MYEKEIEECGFYGVGFETPADVSAYFTVENMIKLLGECVWSQETLDAMREECLQKPLFEMWSETITTSTGSEIFVSRSRPKLEFFSIDETNSRLKLGFFSMDETNNPD